MSTRSTLIDTRRATRWAILCAVIAAAIAICVLRYAPAPTADATNVPSTHVSAASTRHGGPPMRAPDGESLRNLGASGPDATDGVLPGPTSVFSDRYAGITRLNPHLLTALRRAATEAERDGITIDVDSGWRSRAYQQQLFDQAVAQYGSAEAAARWVARPGTSVHEAGDAVDVSGGGVTAWLSQNGAGYGLCRMYGNEPWHFEWRPEALNDGCPTMYADPTHDPRLGK